MQEKSDSEKRRLLFSMDFLYTQCHDFKTEMLNLFFSTYFYNNIFDHKYLSYFWFLNSERI